MSFGDDPQKPDPEKKIIVDSDWKAQVEAEKEKLRQQQEAQAAQQSQGASQGTGSGAEAQPTASAGAQAAAGSEYAQAAAGEAGELPPASFPALVMMLTTQAMAAMGLAAGPDGNPLPPQLPMARHFIDTLSILEEKTRGNLNAEEQQMLGGALHELRLVFVEVSRSGAQ